MPVTDGAKTRFVVLSGMDIKDHRPIARIGPGRPRSEDADVRILHETMTLIREAGVARMSLDEVAARARVSKTTIYRRWPSKTDLAVAAIVEACQPEGPPRSGRPLHDIVDLLSYFRTHFESKIQLPTLGSLLQESMQTPGLLTALRDCAIRRFRSHFMDLIVTARQHGLMREDSDVPITVEMLIGSYYARAIVGDSFSENWSLDLLNGSGLLTDRGRRVLTTMIEQKLAPACRPETRKIARKR